MLYELCAGAFGWPSSRIISEYDSLGDKLEIFSEWRSEAGKNTEDFIPWQSYKDLCSLVFVVVGFAKTYLKMIRAVQ